MVFTGFQITSIVILMVAGSVNTIVAKWMDTTEAESQDGVIRAFEHPFFQSDILFLGEVFSLLQFYIIYYVLKRREDGSVEENSITKGSRTFNPLILWPPALLDLVGTSLMLFGLTMTNASSYQMLRGTVIIFTALLSLCILKRKIKVYEWIGIVLILISMIVIGLADMAQNDITFEQKMDSIMGDVLIIIAQFVAACQFVYEEVFVGKLDIPPLQSVGWEGVFGFLVMTILLFPFYFIPAPGTLQGRNAANSLEDAVDAFVQIGNNPVIIAPLILLFLSIGFYNFSGITLTKELNSTTRMVFDSVRTFIVWIFSISIGWQEFHYLQIIGFIILILGMFVYNDFYVTKIISILKRKLKRDKNVTEET